MFKGRFTNIRIDLVIDWKFLISANADLVVRYSAGHNADSV